MKGRGCVHALVVVLAVAGCREQPPAAEETKTGKVADDDRWIPMTGQWQGVQGGAVEEADGVLRLEWGELLTAARWQGEVPRVPFEVEAEARRIDGVDFFYSVTFPGRTGDEAATLVVGGWGGALVGISSLDGLDASENRSAAVRSFETGRWYRIRLRVTDERIEAWIDGEPVIDVSTESRELSLRPGPIDACLPFGVATWQTTGEVRGMRWRKATEPFQP